MVEWSEASNMAHVNNRSRTVFFLFLYTHIFFPPLMGESVLGNKRKTQMGVGEGEPTAGWRGEVTQRQKSVRTQTSPVTAETPCAHENGG